jgi:uncharacterized membrane protein
MRHGLLLTLAALALTGCNKPAEAPAPAVEPAPAATPAPVPEVKAPPAPAPVLGGVDLTKPVNALGTEPFWGLEIRTDQIKFSGMDRPDKLTANRGAVIEGDTATWRAASAGVDLSVALTAGQCSDGMSDRTYPLKAHVEVGGELFDGCAASTEFIMAKPE